MREQEIWYGRSLKFTALRTLLKPLSWLYAAGWQVYLACYQYGLLKANEPHPRVIVVGGLKVGGVGKSPIAMHLAGMLEQWGYQVVVSLSGYGSPRAHQATLAPSGALLASEWGDESAQFRQVHPQIPLVVGRDRVAAAAICYQQFPNSVLLLDDGFQHLPLKKHIQILLDELSPGNSNTLPAGPYRERRINRLRADLVLPGPGMNYRRETALSSTLPTGSEVYVLCALGNPNHFLASLEATGVKVKDTRLLADHARLQEGSLWPAHWDSNVAVVVTLKDYVKLQERADLHNWQVVVATEKVTFEGADFADWLRNKFDTVGWSKV